MHARHFLKWDKTAAIDPLFWKGVGRSSSTDQPDLQGLRQWPLSGRAAILSLPRKESREIGDW
jgi:hypothetical protein